MKERKFVVVKKVIMNGECYLKEYTISAKESDVIREFIKNIAYKDRRNNDLLLNTQFLIFDDSQNLIKFFKFCQDVPQPSLIPYDIFVRESDKIKYNKNL